MPVAGRPRAVFFSEGGDAVLSRVFGGFMIGGGVWLALTRRGKSLPFQLL